MDFLSIFSGIHGERIMEKIISFDFRPDPLLQSLDLIPVSCGIGIRGRPWPFGYEPHPFIRIYYVEKGSFNLMFPQRIYPLRPGGIYLIPSSIPFQYIFKEECRHFFIHFSSHSLDSIGIFNHPLELSSVEWPEIRKRIMDFVHHALEGCESIRENIERRVLIHQILLPFLEQMNHLHGDELERDDCLYRVMNYIEQNLNDGIDLNELHKKFSMRRSELSARFRQRYGLPPKQYICMRRIANARSMLIRTQKSLQEIATACGYNDLFLFFRMFKKYTRMTPSQFRRHYRQV